MAEILHAVANRASHDVYNRSGEVYQPSTFDSYSQLVTYSPKQEAIPPIATPIPNDQIPDPYISVSTTRGTLNYPNFVSSNRSPYYSGTPPALYHSSSLTNATHMATSGNYNYPYPFPNPLPIFDGSSTYSPSYMGLTQQEVSTPAGVSRGRTQRSLNSENNKASKRKVSRFFTGGDRFSS